MGIVYNIYCDESAHLEHDHLPVMVLGAIWCPLEKTHEIAEQIREIKIQHNLSAEFEIKWIKIGPAKQSFYLDILDYFLGNSDLHLRALVVPDKSKLRHDNFGHDHNTWYYKMYFDLLKMLLETGEHYRIYLDIKDTTSTAKIQKLHDVLCNNTYDFNRKIIERMQMVRSHEVEQIQLADLLIGAINYAVRDLKTNSAKVAFIERMRKYSGYSLQQTTPLQEKKINLFFWEATER